MKKVLYLTFCMLSLLNCSLRAETNEKSDNSYIKEYSIQIGNIVDSIILEDSIIRYITDKNVDEESDYSGYVAQGHIKNISKKTLVDVKIDISFYDKNMNHIVEPGEFEIMVGSSSRDEDLQRVILTVTS